MQDTLSKLQRRLMEEFPEIKADVAENIDHIINAKISIYQSDHINRDVSAMLQEEIKKYIKTQKHREICKKCNKLADEYLENNRNWISQENWQGLLACCITLGTMILRVADMKTEISDWISFAVYLIALLLWTIIVKTKRFMNRKADRFFAAFNRQAPSVIMISSLLFYMVICLCPYNNICIAVIILFLVAIIYFTYLRYKREEKL